MVRPFRFAVQSFSASSGKQWRERAKRASATRRCISPITSSAPAPR
jgi:hypothetical protein